MDPEDVAAILGPYHARVRTELERYGGTVEKFIGDAVMALFGAPVAHEDDPERPCAPRSHPRLRGRERPRATRRNHDRRSARPARCTAGRRRGHGLRGRRQHRRAPPERRPSTACWSTRRRTGRRASAVDYEDAEPVEAKGKAEPIAVWEAQTAHSRFGVDVAHEARADLVGRERELRRHPRCLRARTPRANAAARSRSSACRESARAASCTSCRESPTRPGARHVASGPLPRVRRRRDALGALGDRQGPGRHRRAGLAGRGRAEAPSRCRRRPRGHRATRTGSSRSCGPLVGLSAESELGGRPPQSAFAAWRRFLEAMAEQRPLVVVFEDSTGRTRACSTSSTSSSTGSPTSRCWPSQPRGPSCSSGARLGRRQAQCDDPRAPAAQRGADRAPHRATPGAIRAARRVSAGAAGTCRRQSPLRGAVRRLFLERGSADELRLPETLQGIIAARLDGLADTEKDLLRDAAVVGKVFWASAVRNGSDASTTLHSLERKGFVRRQKRSSVEGETEFAFAHALVRDVAYGQIARADRPRSTAASPSGSRASGVRKTTLRCLPTTGSRRSSSLVPQAWRLDAADSARLALREAGDRAAALNAYPHGGEVLRGGTRALAGCGPRAPGSPFRRARSLHIAGRRSPDRSTRGSARRAARHGRSGARRGG